MDYSPVTGYGYNLAGIAFGILALTIPAWLHLIKLLICHIVMPKTQHDPRH